MGRINDNSEEKEARREKHRKEEEERREQNERRLEQRREQNERRSEQRREQNERRSEQRREKNERRSEQRKMLEEDRREKTEDIRERARSLKEESREVGRQRREKYEEHIREQNEKRAERMKKVEEEGREEVEEIKEHKKRMEEEKRENKKEKDEERRENNERNRERNVRRVNNRKGQAVDLEEKVRVRKERSIQEEPITVDEDPRIKREQDLGNELEIFSNILDLGKNIHEVVGRFKELDDFEVEENDNKRFEEKYKALERNHNAIMKTYHVVNKGDSKIHDNKYIFRKISKVSSKFATPAFDIWNEINKNFEGLREALRELEMKDSLSGIQSEVEILEEAHLRVAKEGFLVEEVGAQAAKTVDESADRLYEHLRALLRSEHALPRNSDDTTGLRALRTLYDGTITYGYIAFPLVLKYYASLADHHYLQDMEEFNKYHSSIQEAFKKFMEHLLGKGHSLIADVNGILLNVKNMNFVSENFNATQCLQGITQMKSGLEGMHLPLMDETPKESLTLTLDCGGKQTPLGDWRDGAQVSYALQYKDGDSVSKVGPWSKPLRVTDRAAPSIKVPVDKDRRTRQIFRKFDDGKADLVAVLTDHYVTEFRDVNRDLYNAASNPNPDDAIREGSILIMCGANVSDVFDWMNDGGTLIHAAARHMNVQFAETFLFDDSKIDINAKDKNSYAAIHTAAISGSEDFVRILMEKGANVNVSTEKEMLTPLHLAGFKGYFSVVEELLSSPTIDVNAREINGFTPFHIAVYGGRLALNSFMKNNKTDVNAKSDAGLTALHLTSANNKYLDIAKELLSNTKVDINAKTSANLTALHYAIANKNEDVAKLLVNQELMDINSKSIGDFTPLHFAIAYENINIASQILKSNTTNVNSKAYLEMSPLHVAAIKGNKDSVALLLRHSVMKEARAKGGLTALHLAAINNDLPVVSVLLDEGADVNSITEDGCTPLHAAAMSKSDTLDLVKELVTNGADWKASNAKGNDVLYLAAASPHQLALVKYITKECPDCISKRNQFGESCLHSAVGAGDLDVVRHLVESNASLKVTNNIDETPLHYAATRGKLVIVAYLIDKDADINAKGWNGQRVLHYAVQSGNVSLVDYLIKTKGCDVNTDTMLLQKPLHLAAQKGQLDVVQYLLKNSANIEVKDWNNRTTLHYAVESGNLNLVTELLDRKNSNVNDKTKDGQTPLHLSAESGNTDMAKLLLNNGAMIGARNSNQDTPLHCGAKKGRLEVVKYLSSKPDIDLNDKGHKNNTALHYATLSGNFELVQFLCGKNVDVNSRSSSLETPLHNAAEVGRLEMVKYLVKKGAELKAVDERNETVLHHAILSGNLELVKYLVEEKRANLEAKTGQGRRGAFLEGELDDLGLQRARVRGWRTPLHYAAAIGDLEIAKYLVEHGASLSARDQAGATPVQMALESGNTKLFQHLVEQASSLDVRNTLYNKTLLQNALGRGNLEAAMYLVNKGVDINEKNAFNKTALHYAVEKGSPEETKFLVDMSADTSVRDWDGGRTPLELARVQNKAEIVKLLGSGRVERSVGVGAVAETHSSLLLADTIIRKLTGRRLVAREKRALSPEEAFSRAAAVTEGFERALLEAASSARVSPHRLELEFGELQREVARRLAGGRASEVAGLLRRRALESLPDSRAGAAHSGPQKNLGGQNR